ncbi:response regulator [Brevundimonas sp.]|uniref:response regulator n=1 Tax=Brevundimonas sp. TaxID=1871086 RepID=UPI002737FD87|nr:response regulator [Brevundimonas sp.]MDP3801709.1 response regulator [Brevundimonas sp.]
MTAFGVRWRLYRKGEPPRGWRDAAVLFAAYVLTLAAGVLWSRSVDNSTVFWAANGVLTAGLLLLRPRLGWAFVAACISLNLAVNVVSGLPPNLNLAFTALNLAFSVVIAVLVRTFCGAALDLGRLRRFVPFVAIVGLVATAEGMIGALFTTPDQGLWQVIWPRWAACDGVGMVLALPAVLLMMRRVNPLYSGAAGRGERAVLLIGLGALTATTFSWAGDPLILLIYPAVLFAAFRLGAAWAFLSVGVVAQIATVQTLADRGPIALFDTTPQFTQVGLLHLFLASILLTATLATSALAERMRTEQRARRKEASAAAVRARSEQTLATRERFLAVVSHEIRTPLNGVAGFAGALAARADLDPEARRQAEAIAASSAVLTALIEDILDFSRLEQGRLELEPAPADVAPVILEAVDRFRAAAAGKGLALSVLCEGFSASPHRVDARRLRQVAAGLIDNAVKFTDAGSVVVRAVLTPGEGETDRLEISVGDTGPGVPEARRGELFQPFAQLDAGLARRQSGAGLGLAMCHSIVALMGGRLTHQAGAEGGSTFRFALDLPRAAPLAGAAGVVAETGRAPRILVVDDHPTNREVARLILTAYGCDVFEADDGATAVAAADGDAFDAILMDVRMPGMDGLDATRAIRASGGPSAVTPILAVTADVMRDDVERCRSAGMNGHVPKPVNPARLMTALTTVLEGGEVFPAPASAPVAAAA